MITEAKVLKVVYKVYEGHEIVHVYTDKYIPTIIVNANTREKGASKMVVLSRNEARHLRIGDTIRIESQSVTIHGKEAILHKLV